MSPRKINEPGVLKSSLRRNSAAIRVFGSALSVAKSTLVISEAIDESDAIGSGASATRVYSDRVATDNLRISTGTVSETKILQHYSLQMVMFISVLIAQ